MYANNSKRDFCDIEKAKIDLVHGFPSNFQKVHVLKYNIHNLLIAEEVSVHTDCI